MSLTSFLQCKDVKSRFKQEFKCPKVQIQKDILAPPLTRRYGTVGTAFDYMLRFYLKRLNPSAVGVDKWVAEHAVSLLLHYPELQKKAQDVISSARVVVAEYLRTGTLTDELIESALSLAYLDPIYRAGRGLEYIGTPVDRKDVEDLHGLVSIINPELFRCRDFCWLNPTFGDASRLVGGADADVVLDNTLIDVKTTKNLKFTRAYFDQLIGYYVLHTLAGVDDAERRPNVTHVAVYFSRHAYLHRLPLSEIIDPSTFPSFIQWFQERARVEFEDVEHDL